VDDERYRRVRDLLHAAAGRKGAERALLLDTEPDPEVRREVERLLAGTGVATNDIFPEAAPAPPRDLGPYALKREIGRGGMGTVYEATDTRSGARVAVKLLHPYLRSSRERFAREARLGRQVEHGNVVRTLDFVSIGAYDLIVMEYVEGWTLREMARAIVPEPRLRDLARQVAEGLAAIHAAGIVHRDLKPENILVDREGAVRIMDLGIAKPGDASVALTVPGQFLGSLPYAAPEQCAGGEAGPAADLYALGVVLHELATGTNPFQAGTPGESLNAQLTFVPAPVASVSPFLASVIATLLEKDPARRFASARVLATALARGEKGAWWTSRGFRT